MVPRFGQNFNYVRIHTDTKTASAAHAINAKVFTVGRDIAFCTGDFQPQRIEGKRLIAHELTHIVQQSNNRLHENHRPTAYVPVREIAPRMIVL